METKTICFLVIAVGILAGILWVVLSRRGATKPAPQPVPQPKPVEHTALKHDCWDRYVRLESIKRHKAKCAKAVAGEGGIITANRQLASILAAENTPEYKAPRIVGQVCDFIINMAMANGMLAESGAITMPAPKPKLMDKDAFFRNMQVAPDAQADKYRSVIKYQEEEIEKEKSNLKFVNALQALIPLLETVTYLSANEASIEPQQIVDKATDYLNKSQLILTEYGIDR